MSDRVTIKSIARDLGISHMTVSRALSGHPNVQKQTRETILKHARETGYVKSAAAKAMRGDGTKIVGLLLPNIVNEFYARFANTMALACEVQGLQLIIHLTGDEIRAEEKALERLREVQSQAVVLVPSPGQRPGELASLYPMRVIQLIRKREFADPTAAILVNDSKAIRDAVEHLAGQGHRAIAYLGADAELSSGRSRLAAFLQGLTEAGLKEIPELIHTAAPSLEMGRDKGRIVLNNTKATAIVCGGFEISNGALSSLLETSPQGKHTVDFVGYGDPSFYSWLSGGISTIQVPVNRLAYKAIELVTQPHSTQTTPSATFEASFISRNTSSG